MGNVVMGLNGWLDVRFKQWMLGSHMQSMFRSHEAKCIQYQATYVYVQ
jgi:hypothetical protein